MTDRQYETDHTAEKARETAREVTRETTAEPAPETRTDVQVTRPPEYYTAPPPPPPAPRTEVHAPGRARRRPVGITILAILGVLAGLFTILSALGSFALAGYFSQSNIPQDVRNQIPDWFESLAPAFFIGTGVVMLIVAILLFLVAWAFIKGSNWGRVLAMVLLALLVVVSLISIISSIASGNWQMVSMGSLLLSIIIPAAIIWYLTTSHVKQWFNPGFRQGYDTPGYFPSFGRR